MKRGRLALRRGLCALAFLGGAALIGYRGGAAAWLLFWAGLLPPLLALVWYLAGLRRLRCFFSLLQTLCMAEKPQTVSLPMLTFLSMKRAT